MANTKIPAELSSTPGIIDNSNATAITIDSSENVGIGTDDVTDKLTINADAGDGITFDGISASAAAEQDVSDIKFINRRSSGTTVKANIKHITHGTANGSALTFGTTTGSGATEKMRIDSSGNLLVGKTSTAIENVGVSLFATGRVISTADGDDVAVLNRKSSDGDIAVFRKDGTTVGSIGSVSGANLSIKSDDGVLYIGGDQNGAIRAINNLGSGQPRLDARDDATTDLGTGTNRFKNLYLSGGVYLGGTGTANKLDDYEEGTWTPTLTAGTFSSTSATYTKVGNMITINLDAVVGTGGATKITNLPFTAANTVGCGIYASGQAVSSRTQFNWVIAGVSAFFRGTGDSVAFTTQSLSSGATIHASITYRTS